jgi:thioredoxin 1
MGKQSFEQQVLASSSPVLVHFSAPWCGPCRVIDSLLSRFQAECCSSLNLVRINTDENLKLASHYRITTLPTLLFFEGGKLHHRMEGIYKREVLWAELDKFVSKSLSSNSLVG